MVVSDRQLAIPKRFRSCPHVRRQGHERGLVQEEGEQAKYGESLGVAGISEVPEEKEYTKNSAGTLVDHFLSI